MYIFFTCHFDMFVEISIYRINLIREYECLWHDSISSILLLVHSIGRILSKGRYNLLHYPQGFERCIFVSAWFPWNHLVLFRIVAWAIHNHLHFNILRCLQCSPRNIQFEASWCLDTGQDKLYFSFGVWNIDPNTQITFSCRTVLLYIVAHSCFRSTY